MKKFKKLISLSLCFMMLFALLAPMASVSAVSGDGVSIDAGSSALRAQFTRGYGPKKDGYAVDYSIFSPVKGDDDTTKYPLVVFITGYKEGAKEGDELEGNRFCTWSSRELQARFTDAGGAYIMILRTREDAGLLPNSPLLVSPNKAAVDDFIKKNPNVDETRIYIIGWSYGAVGAIYQATTYPNFYAAAIFFAQTGSISADEAATLSNTAVWIDACKTDMLASYDLYAGTSWKNLVNKAADKSRIRLTTYDSAPDTGVFIRHNTWADAYYDLHSGDERYVGMKTIDGNGNPIDTDSTGMISWLSAQRLQYDNTDNCSCNCHSGNMFTKFFWSIQVFFWKLFGMSNKRVCACGVKHW